MIIYPSHAILTNTKFLTNIPYSHHFVTHSLQADHSWTKGSTGTWGIWIIIQKTVKPESVHHQVMANISRNGKEIQNSCFDFPHHVQPLKINKKSFKKVILKKSHYKTN